MIEKQCKKYISLTIFLFNLVFYLILKVMHIRNAKNLFPYYKILRIISTESIERIHSRSAVVCHMCMHGDIRMRNIVNELYLTSVAHSRYCACVSPCIHICAHHRTWHATADPTATSHCFGFVMYILSIVNLI